MFTGAEQMSWQVGLVDSPSTCSVSGSLPPEVAPFSNPPARQNRPGGGIEHTASMNIRTNVFGRATMLSCGGENFRYPTPGRSGPAERHKVVAVRVGGGSGPGR